MQKLMLSGLMAASALIITGCATTSGLKPEQCKAGDWQAIGYQDGLMGRDANYITRHTDRCGKVGVAPNQPLWEQGRQEGLKRYCTPLRAYQLGREGIAYNNVCPADQMLELLKAHDEGNYYYQLNQSWDYFNYGYDPFWGDRWWGSPFYSGYPWGRFSPLPYPRVVPNYVPSTPKSGTQKIAPAPQGNAPVTTAPDAKTQSDK